MTDGDVDATFQNALEAYCRVYLRTALRNLPEVASHPTVTRLAGMFEGRPAVLVAAGPSLDKNVGQLAALKGKVLLIGINQSLRAMRAAGVEPDICLAVDPLDMRYHFDGQPVPVLGVCPSVHKGLFEMGRHVFTLPASRETEGWIYDAMGAPQFWHVGNSVAHHAFHLAMHLRCNPIAVVGQDFALNGQQYYAHNAADGGEQQLVEDAGTLSTKQMYRRDLLSGDDAEHFKAVMVSDSLRLQQVPGWGGGEVTTTTDLFPMLALYKRIAKGAAAVGVKLYNCTEGGAYVDGMEHVPLNSVRFEAHDIVPAASLEARLRTGPDTQWRRNLHEAVAAMRTTLGDLGRLADTLLAKLERGPSPTREQFLLCAAHAPFFHLWCVRELRAIERAKQPPAIHVAMLERWLYLAAKSLCDEVGVKLRHAAKGLASTRNSFSPSGPQRISNTFLDSAKTA